MSEWHLQTDLDIMFSPSLDWSASYFVVETDSGVLKMATGYLSETNDGEIYPHVEYYSSWGDSLDPDKIIRWIEVGDNEFGVYYYDRYQKIS